MRSKSGPPADPWQTTGAQIADTLESFHAVVVCGDDHDATARVALGIAGVLTDRRRVVIADLVGDLAPLESLVAGAGTGHGASDAALYGVSLTRVTYPVKPVRNLFIIPSGTDDVQQEEVFASTRWFGLAREFRRTGALLLLVAPASASGLKRLVDALDGAVVVGRVLVNPPPFFLVLRRVDLATPQPRRRFPAKGFSLRPPTVKIPRSPRAYAIAGAGTLLLVVGTAAVTLSRTSARDVESLAPPSVSTAPAPPAPPIAGVLPPANPGDSAEAAAYGVEILAANTPEGASFELREKLKNIPAGTISPVPVGDERVTWYKVVVGAYRDAGAADSLLLAIRRSGLVGDSAGSIVWVPLALLIDSVPPQGGVTTTVNRYLSRGMHVYALLQPAGDALLYAGAFTSAADASVLADSLRAAGLNPLLVYRKGELSK